MFDVGFLEVLVIGIVALIVIGPERLPAVARTVGTWVGKAQRFVRGVKSDFASELKSGDLKKIIGDQNEQISELRNIVNSARQELKAGVDEATAATRSSVEDFKKTVEDDDTGSANSGTTTNNSADNSAGSDVNTSADKGAGNRIDEQPAVKSSTDNADNTATDTASESKPASSHANQQSD